MKLAAGDRVLVTGGTGVIGAWVVRELLDHGLVPVVLTRGMTKVGNPLFADRLGDIEFISCDIERPWTVAEAFRCLRPVGVVHLASVKPWQIDAGFVARPDPLAGVTNLVVGSANLLEAARQFGVKRFVYGSSKAVYREFSGVHAYPDYRPVDETYPCDPRSMYGIGKLSAELTGRYYAETFGLDVLSVRFGTCYGPFKRGGGHHPAALMIAAADGKPIRMTSDAFTWRQLKDDYVHNRDVARGIVLACLADAPRQNAYNLATGTGRSLEEVVAAIREALPAARIEVDLADSALPPITGLLRSQSGILAIDAARRDLGYAPAYGLVDGVRETARYYDGDAG